MSVLCGEQRLREVLTLGTRTRPSYRNVTRREPVELRYGGGVVYLGVLWITVVKDKVTADCGGRW